MRPLAITGVAAVLLLLVIPPIVVQERLAHDRRALVALARADGMALTLCGAHRSVTALWWDLVRVAAPGGSATAELRDVVLARSPFDGFAPSLQLDGIGTVSVGGRPLLRFSADRIAATRHGATLDIVARALHVAAAEAGPDRVYTVASAVAALSCDADNGRVDAIVLRSRADGLAVPDRSGGDPLDGDASLRVRLRPGSGPAGAPATAVDGMVSLGSGRVGATVAGRFGVVAADDPGRGELLAPERGELVTRLRGEWRGALAAFGALGLVDRSTADAAAGVIEFIASGQPVSVLPLALANGRLTLGPFLLARLQAIPFGGPPTDRFCGMGRR